MASFREKGGQYILSTKLSRASVGVRLKKRLEGPETILRLNCMARGRVRSPRCLSRRCKTREVDKCENEETIQNNASDHDSQMRALILLAGTGCRCSWHEVFPRASKIKFRSCDGSQAARASGALDAITVAVRRVGMIVRDPTTWKLRRQYQTPPRPEQPGVSIEQRCSFIHRGLALVAG